MNNKGFGREMVPQISEECEGNLGITPHGVLEKETRGNFVLDSDRSRYEDIRVKIFDLFLSHI